MLFKNKTADTPPPVINVTVNEKKGIIRRIISSMLISWAVRFALSLFWYGIPGFIPLLLAAILGWLGWIVTPPGAVKDTMNNMKERVEGVANRVGEKLHQKVDAAKDAVKDKADDIKAKAVEEAKAIKEKAETEAKAIAAKAAGQALVSAGDSVLGRISEAVSSILPGKPAKRQDNAPKANVRCMRCGRDFYDHTDKPRCRGCGYVMKWGDAESTYEMAHAPPPVESETMKTFREEKRLKDEAWKNEWAAKEAAEKKEEEVFATHLITAFGESKTADEWAKDDLRADGLYGRIIYNRIKSGWEPEKAITLANRNGNDEALEYGKEINFKKDVQKELSKLRRTKGKLGSLSGVFSTSPQWKAMELYDKEIKEQKKEDAAKEAKRFAENFVGPPAPPPKPGSRLAGYGTVTY